MCGRFTTPERDAIVERLEAEDHLGSNYQRSFNVAPTQHAPVVRYPDSASSEKPAAERPEATLLRWGLVPRWAKDLDYGARTINARSETAPTKASFRAAWRHRRCLVPVTGFFEWQKTTGGQKQPFYFYRSDEPLMLLAGLWEHWPGNDDTGPVQTFTILTTEANDQVSGLHDRMPVMIEPADRAAWLTPEADADQLAGLCESRPWPTINAHPISRRVNSPKHNDPHLLEPVELAPDTLFE
jgi:putative SOS response-associated peptidase YedK